MARGWLDDDTLKSLAGKIPNTQDLEGVLDLDPQLISSVYPYDSTVPTAAPCLLDTWHFLRAASYALHEALAEATWYSEKRTPPAPVEAIFFGSFFVDDCTQRLYAAGEHLAAAILRMLEIDEKTLPSANGRTSRQARVASFLKQHEPTSTIAQVVMRLGQSRAWRAAMKHRNRWVHAQPPRVAGLGLSFSRKKRWNTSVDGKTHTLPLGAGDPPDADLTSLLSMSQDAIADFAEAFRGVRDAYLAILSSAPGISVDSNGKVRVAFLAPPPPEQP
jgi:hypothetical protein